MATMGFGLHSRPIPNTPRRIAKCRFKSRIANLFMKLRSIVLEMRWGWEKPWTIWCFLGGWKKLQQMIEGEVLVARSASIWFQNCNLVIRTKQAGWREEPTAAKKCFPSDSVRGLAIKYWNPYINSCHSQGIETTPDASRVVAGALWGCSPSRPPSWRFGGKVSCLGDGCFQK